jgi:hypothetical protein
MGYKLIERSKDIHLALKWVRPLEFISINSSGRRILLNTFLCVINKNIGLA